MKYYIADITLANEMIPFLMGNCRHGVSGEAELECPKECPALPYCDFKKEKGNGPRVSR